MQTIVLETPGKLTAADRPKPVLLPGEALVRVHRVGVCGTDTHAFEGTQPFFSYPRVLGHELGVEVVDPGDAPHGLKPGDRCAVEPYIDCGSCIACRSGKPNCCTKLKVLGVHADGGMAEYFAVPARKLHKSDKLGYDQLALVETLGIGAHAVERAAVSDKDFVLVIGVGPIGISAVQFALGLGAQVAIMDTSATRLEFCSDNLGVRQCVNPLKEETVARLTEFGGGDLPNVVIDATGNAKSMQAAFDLPAHGGRLVFVGLVLGEITFNDPNFHRRELTVFASRNSLPETFRSIISLVEAGKIDTTPWITHRLSLRDVPRDFVSTTQDKNLLKAMISVAEAEPRV
jgi:2-desacetyl-2-hydroxyethyl bacteriochlorophyllide A dehydrogenase